MIVSLTYFDECWYQLIDEDVDSFAQGTTVEKIVQLDLQDLVHN